MGVRILLNDSARGKSASVTINAGLKRATLNLAGLELLKGHYKKEPNYVQVMIDDDNPKCFYLRLCDQESPGSRKMDQPSKSNRSINISSLIREINLKLETTQRFPLVWNDQVGAGEVTLDKTAEVENEK
jgi:hypothetical protein